MPQRPLLGVAHRIERPDDGLGRGVGGAPQYDSRHDTNVACCARYVALVSPGHPALTGEEVLAHGGWHPRYARVLAVASDGDHAFALVDGNGDGAELEAEAWLWDGRTWEPGNSSGAGPLGGLGREQTGGEAGPACFAFGRVPGRQSVTVEFDGQLYQVPVSRHGIWAFIKARAGRGGRGFPSLTD
jgi:hypothetical protein